MSRVDNLVAALEESVDEVLAFFEGLDDEQLDAQKIAASGFVD